MANLLPQIKKKHVRREYRIRVGVVTSFLVSAVLLVSLILLVPSYVLSSVKYRITLNELNVEKERIAETKEGSNLKEIAREVNEQLTALQAVTLPSRSVYDFFLSVIEERPFRIKINSMFYTDSAGEDTFSITGVAGTRNDLLNFIKRLEGSELFEGVDLPVSNFVKDSNIEYSLKMVIKENKKEDEMEK